MGTVIPLFSETPLPDPRIAFILRDTSHASQHRVELERRILAILSHVNCPDLSLSHRELDRLRQILTRIDPDPYRRQEAYLASIFRMGAVHGWNPNHTWPLRKQGLPIEAKRYLEASYGMIGLLWQSKYCLEIAYSFEDNSRLIPH